MVQKRLTVEDILADELRREMNLDTRTYLILDEWDTVMHSVYQMPIEYAGYTAKVGELKMLKDMVNVLSSSDFDQVKRSESRKKQMREFTKTLSMYYNLVFTKGKKKTGYGALIHFPRLQPQPERSSGIVLLARIVVQDGKPEISFEKGKFEDFLLEVKPYINLLGDLYRKSRRP